MFNSKRPFGYNPNYYKTLSRGTAKLFFNFSSSSHNKSDGDTVIVNISRDTSAGAVSAKLSIVNGKETTAENHGIGANYQGDSGYTWSNNAYESNFATVEFADGQSTKTLSLTLSNNSVYELPRNLTLYLSTSNSNYSISGGSRTITIIDDNVPKTSYDGNDYVNIINAKDPEAAYDVSTQTWTSTKARDLNYPLAGDDSTNDSTNFQAIVNWLNTNGGGILYFPAGTYLIDDTTIYSGISFFGAGKAQTIIKRYSPTALFQVADRYQRVLYCSYSGSSDSSPLVFRDLTLDGNLTPFALWFSFNGQPTAGQSFTLDSTGTADTWTYVSGTPDDRQIQIGATYADTVTNTKNALEAAGYVVVRKTGDNYIISVYHPDWLYSDKYIHYSENVSNLTLSSYEWASILFTSGSSSYAGRLLVTLEQVTLSNNPASEGIHCNNNTDVNFYYVDDGGNTPFGRGFIDLTGGYSIWRMKNIEGTYVHTELDVSGYANPSDASTKVFIEHYLDDVTLYKLTLSMSDGGNWPYNSSNSKIICNNVTVTGGWKYYGPLHNYIPVGNVSFNNCYLGNYADVGMDMCGLDCGGNAKFTDCVLQLGPNGKQEGTGDSTSSVAYVRFKNSYFYRTNNTVYRLGDLRRANTPYNEDVAFEVTAAGTSGSSEPSWNMTPGTTTTDGTVTWTCRDASYVNQKHAAADAVVEFKNCEFIADSGNPCTAVLGVSQGMSKCDWNMYNNKIVMDGCTFSGNMHYAFGNGRYGSGGYYEAINCVFNNTGMVFRTGGSADDANWKLLINGGTFNHGGSYFGYIYNCPTDYNYIYLQDITVDYSCANMQWFSYSGNAGRLNADRISGTGVMRQITGATTAPTSGNRAFKNADGTCYDTWYDANTGKTYKVNTVDPMAWVAM